MQQMRKLSKDSLNADILIGLINKTWQYIHLNLIKKSNDTMFLKIADSYILTERIGTTGAMQYLSEVVYNLTELKNIKYISLDFEEGEHLSPGTWCRQDFDNK